MTRWEGLWFMVVGACVFGTALVPPASWVPLPLAAGWFALGWWTLGRRGKRRPKES